eukprot:TRINITY_DN19649_c1_g1_i4.p1 TRINITY_DN19649_c1_g1~~TRINITY_DN19649_c1_g1_i4.p1  ORF type:complete len:402 (+),score=106.22 TRINITY_DN19649_c1_g1_i4:60-1265(+)
MSKGYIQRAILASSETHRTGHLVLKELKREKDTVNVSKPRTSRAENVSAGLPLGWRDGRTSAFFHKLSAELEKMWQNDTGKVRDGKIVIAVSTMLKELKNIYNEGAIVDTHTYATVVERFFRWKQYRSVLQLGAVMRAEHVIPTRATYIYLIIASSREQPQYCKLWWQRACNDGHHSLYEMAVPPLIRSLGAMNKEEEAWGVFKGAWSAGVRLHRDAYHELLFCCKDAKTSGRVWSMMKEANITMDTMTLNLVLRACSFSSDVESALSIYEEARSLGITPRLETYRALISLYFKAGMLDEAIGVIATMSDNSVRPDCPTLERVLGACCDATTGKECKYYKLAELLFCQILQTYGRTHKAYTNMLQAAIAAGDRDTAVRLKGEMEAAGYALPVEMAHALVDG